MSSFDLTMTPAGQWISQENVTISYSADVSGWLFQATDDDVTWRLEMAFGTFFGNVQPRVWKALGDSKTSIALNARCLQCNRHDELTYRRTEDGVCLQVNSMCLG